MDAYGEVFLFDILMRCNNQCLHLIGSLSSNQITMKTML